MVSGHAESGEPVVGTLLVASDTRGAWRAGVPLLALALIIAVPSSMGEESSVSAPMGVAAVTAIVGLARASFWYRCGDDSLWDDGVHLIWARRGRVVTLVAWDQLTWVSMESVVLPEWRARLYTPPASLPEVWVESRTAPEGNFVGNDGHYLFATLVLIRRAQVRTAEEQLDAACRARGIIDSASDRRLPWRSEDA